jgi:hypothetical protein
MVAPNVWSKAGSNILAPELLNKIRDILERETDYSGAQMYAASSAPLRLVFDEYEDFLHHLKSRARPRDHLLIWGYSDLCRNDNIFMHAKYPDDAGRTPRGGAY